MGRGKKVRGEDVMEADYLKANGALQETLLTLMREKVECVEALCAMRYALWQI